MGTIRFTKLKYNQLLNHDDSIFTHVNDNSNYVVVLLQISMGNAKFPKCSFINWKLVYTGKINSFPYIIEKQTLFQLQIWLLSLINRSLYIGGYTIWPRSKIFWPTGTLGFFEFFQFYLQTRDVPANSKKALQIQSNTFWDHNLLLCVWHSKSISCKQMKVVLYEIINEPSFCILIFVFCTNCKMPLKSHFE